tara:strand:- start:41856 stop:43010 length:1155 start_codon:yes stop_codon:yes gene_type:complete
MLEYGLISLYGIIIVLLVITYILYPFLSKKLFKSHSKDLPRENYGTSYILIPAYNEENVIEEKIINALKNKGEKEIVVVVSDSSDDATNSICKRLVAENDEMRFLVNNKRGGKNTCLNYAIETIKPKKNDILIFTDCNTFFDQNSIPEIHKSLLSGSALTAGSMVYKSMDSDSAVSEGLYWRYEEWLRKNESEKGRLIVCNGGLFGMWAEYFEEIPPFVPNDLEGPLRLLGEAKYVEINPLAKGFETAINSASEEYNRKHRMANRQMNCIIYLWNRINFGTKLQVLFHKFFRWFGLHLFILATLIIIALDLISGTILIKLLVWTHSLIVVVMFLAWLNNYVELENRFLPKVLHACIVHLYGAKGAFKAFMGAKTTVWEKAKTNR